MILFVEHNHLQHYPGLKTAIYDLRAEGLSAEAFANEAAREAGVVFDMLDESAPSYLLCLSEETGAVMGALRILQTMGPHMLSDVVPQIMGDDYPLRSPCLWEISRICVAQEPGDMADGYTRERVASEMMIGAISLALRSGITEYLTVLNVPCEKLLSRIGAAPDSLIGQETIKSWGIEVSAGILECKPERISTVRQSSGIAGDIWANQSIMETFEGKDRSAAVSDMALMFKRALCGDMPEGIQHRLQLYCAQQLLDAKTAEEGRDALRLIRELGRIIGPLKRVDGTD